MITSGLNAADDTADCSDNLNSTKSTDGSAGTLTVVDLLKQHNYDYLACLWIVLYTVISLQKEKSSRAPSVESCVLWNLVTKTMVIISDYTLTLKEDLGVFCSEQCDQPYMSQLSGSSFLP